MILLIASVILESCNECYKTYSIAFGSIVEMHSRQHIHKLVVDMAKTNILITPKHMSRAFSLVSCVAHYTDDLYERVELLSSTCGWF